MLADRLHRLEDRPQVLERVELLRDALRPRPRPSSPCGSSSARSRSERVTTPTTSPSRRTGTRPALEVRRRAASPRRAERSSAHVTTSEPITLFTGACERPWPIALSRSSRVTMPARSVGSPTCMPLWRWRWHSTIAWATVSSGETKRAGRDMISPAVRPRRTALGQRLEHAGAGVLEGARGRSRRRPGHALRLRAPRRSPRHRARRRASGRRRRPARPSRRGRRARGSRSGRRSCGRGWRCPSTYSGQLRARARAPRSRRPHAARVPR